MAHSLLFANIRQIRIRVRQERVHRVRNKYLDSYIIHGHKIVCSVPFQSRFHQFHNKLDQKWHYKAQQQKSRIISINAGPDCSHVLCCWKLTAGDRRHFLSGRNGCQCVSSDHMSEALRQKLGQFVQFPAKTAPVKASFFQVAWFPSVIVYVDSSHIRIIAPDQ